MIGGVQSFIHLLHCCSNFHSRCLVFSIVQSLDIYFIYIYKKKTFLGMQLTVDQIDDVLNFSPSQKLFIDIFVLMSSKLNTQKREAPPLVLDYTNTFAEQFLSL